MNVKVTFDGKNFTNDLTKKLEAECEQAIKMIAMKIEADAKELCPVDTGCQTAHYRRNSIRKTSSKIGKPLYINIL